MPGLSFWYSCQMRILKTLPYIIRRLITNNSSICHPSNHTKVKNKRTGLYPVHILIYSSQRYSDIDASLYYWKKNKLK